MNNIRNPKKEWTQNEETYLIDNFNQLSIRKFSKLFDRSESSVQSRARKLKLKKSSLRKYNVDLLFFSQENIQSSYWAGFIAADGALIDSGNHYDLAIMLSESDIDHLKKFIDHCKYSGSIKIRAPRGITKQNVAHLIICGVKIWFNDLHKKYNITPRKSLTLKPPNINNLENKLAFIKGIIDGDGTIAFENNRYLYIQIIGTFSLLSWIKNIFDDISPNKKFATVRKAGSSKVFCLKIKGKRAEDIFLKLKKIKSPEMERKWLIKI